MTRSFRNVLTAIILCVLFISVRAASAERGDAPAAQTVAPFLYPPYPGSASQESIFDHSSPTYITDDRVVAYTGDEVIYQSGVFADGEVVSTETDPDLWLLRDETFDENGNETHMFWNVADINEKTLPVQLTTNPAEQTLLRSRLAAVRP